MRYQIDVVASRDGPDAALAYAQQSLHAYRSAARARDAAGRRHFAHDALYRRLFVNGIREIREYLRFARDTARPNQKR